MKHFLGFCVAAWFLSPLFLCAQSPVDPPLVQALASISKERLMADVAALSSDAMNGRQAGTADDDRAAAYIARELGTDDRTLPLSRLPMDETSPITITQIAPGVLMMVRFPGQAAFAEGNFEIGTDYLPILDSPSVDVQAPIVFVGYGIIDHDRGFDEYTGVDVKNRVVLFLRGKPESYAGQVSHADKVRVAQERGAVAYLTATGPIRNAYEARRGVGGNPFAYYGHVDSPGLAGAWIATDLAERLVSTSGRSLQAEQEALNRLSARSRPLNADIKVRWTSVQTTGALRNVGFLLRGSDPERQQETIILGAHRDHFGNQAGVLFTGADDNASGTAVMLEVARALAQTGYRPKRSILFLSFTGEEQGLLGSKLYVAHPARPLDRTMAMINIDHAGIGNGRLTVGLTGVSKPWAVEVGRIAGMEDRVDLFGYFPGGDHVPFMEASIPTITIVSGGSHTHFHQPTDMVETLNPEILLSVARYTLIAVLTLADIL